VTEFIGRYREAVERLVQAVLGTAGDTHPSLRRAVEARAAALGGRATAPSNETLAASVDRYVSTVALHAYKVTDADVDTLKDAGFSEDAIFEITLSAALGAALGRLERGLGALRGTGYETQNG
jgi:alkylhydroperoxidase family enzyme